MAYYLEFDGSVGAYVNVPSWTPQSADDWSFEVEIQTSNDITTDQLVIGREGYFKLYINSGKIGILHRSKWATSGFIQAPATANTFYLVRGEFDGTEIRLYFDNVLVASETGRNLAAEQGNNNTTSISGLAQYRRLKNGARVYSAKLYDDATQTNLSRHYNPTLSAEAGGTLLIDEVGGEHGTLNGFSSNPFVYYYDFLNPSEEDTTADNCLKLTSASESISLPLIGAYDVDAYLTDGSTVNFTGSGTLVISGATPREITKVIGNDSNNDVFYDFNRSAATAPVVPELINGQNGTIVGGATYEPIIEKQVFTVGAGKDYPDVSVWGQDSQIRNGDFHPVALCYGTQLLTDDVDIHSGFLQGYTIEGATGNFTGDFNDSDIAKITNDPSWTSWLFDERIGQGNFKNIILEAGNNEVFYREAFSGGKFDRVGLTRKTEGQVLSLKTSGTTITLNNCVITNTNFSTGQSVAYFGSGGSPSARRVEIYNSVVYGNTNATYGTARFWNVDAEIYNSVFYNKGTALAITDTLAQGGVSTFTGDNNLSNTADDVQSSTRRGSANELGIGESNFDFTGAFNDSANGDYRVLQTYADTNLVGQGWNGSDIGASFYFDGSTPPVTATDTVKVLRGSTIIADGQTALTLQNGVDYTLEDTDDTKWYFRITNNHFTGMGTTSGGGNQVPDRITVHAVQSGADVILNRPDGTNDNRVDWEIIQYTGNTPENEFVVREKGNITLAATELTQTVTLPPSVVNADDVVILITGQSTTESGGEDTNACLLTAVRSASDWVATCGKSTGTTNLSYAVIEYTGSDYTVTQESFTASTNADTHTLVTPVADAAQTFIHAHYRYDTNSSSGLDDCSVRVYLQDENTISIHNDTSTDLALKQHHVYLIQNPNLTVQRHTGEMAGVGEEEIHGVAITTVANLELSSLGGLSASSTGSGSAFPRGFINFTLENDSSVMLRQSDNGQTSQYAFEVIEWPSGDSGGGYSLTLTQAAFNFSGSDIGTVKDSIVSISSGTANLSGEDTETLKGSLISADSGSISITGRGVNLRRNALLSINTGSATFAGDDIGINKVTVNDLVLSLDSGNTVMRGVPVDLLADRLAAIESGSQTLTGSSVDVKADRRTTIETGSYALTGQDFTIKAGRKVTLGNGEATLNGQPLSIVYTPAGGYTIALGTGGALLTGGSITTIADRIAQVDAGSTDLIGNVIELSAHRKINPEPGNLTLTGQQIDCLYGRSITIEPTSFSLTGAQVVLDWSGFVEVRLNGYSLRFEQSLIQPKFEQSLITSDFNQSLINMRFGA